MGHKNIRDGIPSQAIFALFLVLSHSLKLKLIRVSLHIPHHPTVLHFTRFTQYAD